MELLDIYDRYRNKTGETVKRGTPLAEGQYRLVVHLCIFNSAGLMLIQQRIATKDSYPNLWDITLGGCATSGDTSQTAIHRELLEELGLDRDFSETNPYLSINDNTVFDDYYILCEDVDLNVLRLQKEEVQAVKWASVEQIHKLIDQKKFIPYYHELIDLLFAIKANRGAHNKKLV